jgi:hypothetical protein
LEKRVKTILSIATAGARPHQLANTLESLKGQADEIRVYDNSRFIDYKAAAKFYPLQFIKEPVYFLTCDDDLIYPQCYVENMKRDIEAYKSIITYHGRILKEGQNTYYGSAHEGVHHWKLVTEPRRLDTIGTGCAGFRTDYFNPVDLYKTPHNKMVDLVCALEAWKQGKQIITPPKRMDYIIEQPVNSSILATESKTDQKWQVWHVNQILTLKNS